MLNIRALYFRNAAAIGWALFGGMLVTPLSILGLVTTFLGAFAYSYISVTKQLAAQLLKQDILTSSSVASGDISASKRHVDGEVCTPQEGHMELTATVTERTQISDQRHAQ
jgi:hypothetical protein